MPAAASAGSVEVTGGTLAFNATGSETNRVTVERISVNFFRLRDDATPLIAGADCEQSGTYQVRCAAGMVTAIEVNTRDLDDTAQIISAADTTPATLRGGPGLDQLTGGPGADALVAGAGPPIGVREELLRGGPGADTPARSHHGLRG